MRDVLALVLAALGQHDAERAAGDLRVGEEQFVEVAHPIEQQAVGIGGLDARGIAPSSATRARRSGGRAESPVASPDAGGAAVVAWFIGRSLAGRRRRRTAGRGAVHRGQLAGPRRAEFGSAGRALRRAQRRARARSPRATKAFAAATASARSAPSAIWAAIALDSVQPVPCRLREASRGAAKRRTPAAVTSRSTASSPARWPPFISTARGPQREQRAPLRGHLLFARGDGVAEQRRRLGEIGRQAIDQRQQPRLDRRDKPGAGERVAGGSDHHGVVDDEGPLIPSPPCGGGARRSGR